MKNAAPAPSGIILFAKQPGKTSFSSLFTVKHALGTKKVGHTGTLDSFAQGLMVVLSEGMTRLVPYITAFDKTYEAVITFGAETDTLDPNGTVVRTAPLPDAGTLTGAIARFRGTFDQVPPLYSAVHVDGKRASDAARKGAPIDIPPRKVTVYSSEIIEMISENGEEIPPFDLSAAGELVRYAHIRFHVSKGTYIRSLARDIASACGSAAHLEGLLRTKVGSFSLEDAAGRELLKPFSIAGVLAENEEIAAEKVRGDEQERALEQAVREKMKTMNRDVARECGLTPVTLRKQAEKSYFNGQPLASKMFDEIPSSDGFEAVFTEDDVFAGVITLNDGRIRYQYVVPRVAPASGNAAAPKDTLPESDSQSSETPEEITSHEEMNAGKETPGNTAGDKTGPEVQPSSETFAKKEGAPSDSRTPVIDARGRMIPVSSDAEDSTGMKIFTWEDILASRTARTGDVRDFFRNGSALTIGGFDGPHKGHLKLFDSVMTFATRNELETGIKLKRGVVTFRQPPHSVTSPNLFSGDISTLQLKLDLFTMKGFDFVILIDFSSDFSRMKGNDFLSILKDCCSMQFAAAGVDFRCGYQLDTGVAELSAFARQNGFQFQVIDDVTYNGTRISSSLIRTCVQTGKLHEAEMLLGRPYAVDLRNVTGSIRNELHCLLQIANGDVLQILPPDGTYDVKVTSAGARTCNTVLHVDSSLLRLEIPPEWSSTGIEKIEFTTLVS